MAVAPASLAPSSTESAPDPIDLAAVVDAATAAVADDPANRRGPFRPNRMAPVRERLSGPTLTRVFRLLDASLVAAVTLAAADLTAADGLMNQSFGAVLPLIVAPLVTLWMLNSVRAYGLSARETLGRHLSRAVTAGLIGGLAGLIVAALTHLASPTVVALFALAMTAALVGAHLWAWTSVRHWRDQGKLTPNVVVVGATANAARLIESALATREVNVLGIFDDRTNRIPAALGGVPVLGDTHALIEHKMLPYVDRIVITVTASAQTRVRQLIEQLRVLPNAVTLFVDVEGQDTRASTLSRMANAPLSQVSGIEEDERRAFHKRVQDLIIAVLAMAVAAPVMAIVAVAIRLDSPGPILFRQRRHGFNNEAITVWKFRSMRVEATDHTAKRQVEKNDTRVTKVGRFIRKTSLDELPQIFNVLTGEMSLVGPRPHPIGMMTAGEESQRLVAEYAWRHRMKPGITGWAQINGSRGPIHTREEVRQRVVLDVEYIERQSFWFDLYIMVMTLPCLLGDKDAIR
jgi:Undecaprenyl-phosphate glucose phosphotransferase